MTVNIYETKTMGSRIHGNEYVGRGIVIGKTEDGTRAAIAYFIMGRSENSRNRIFREEGKDYSYNDMEQLARNEKPFEFFIDPDEDIFASPKDMPKKIRDYCKKTGQGEPKSDGALVRCIYESLAMKYRFAIKQIEENTGKRFDVLHLLGGGTKDSFLCQMTADSLNLPVVAGPNLPSITGRIPILG